MRVCTQASKESAVASHESPASDGVWRKFVGDMVVPMLLCAYATYYYLDVAQLPNPETNLLLIEPVYWILIVCSLLHGGFRLRETLRASSAGKPEPDEAQIVETIRIDGRAIAFIVLTMGCVWLIPILGFATTIAAYTALMLLALGVRTISALVLIPTLLAGSLWAGMELFLNLRVPTGLLF